MDGLALSKHVNDTFGHITGDRILAKVDEILKSNLRQTDTSSRLGGDELSAMFSYSHLTQIIPLAHKLHSLIKNISIEDCSDLKVNISGGIVEYTDSVLSSDHFISTVDAFLYKAKLNCKGRIEY